MKTHSYILAQRHSEVVAAAIRLRRAIEATQPVADDYGGDTHALRSAECLYRLDVLCVQRVQEVHTVLAVHATEQPDYVRSGE